MPKPQKKLIDVRGMLRRLGNRTHRFFLQKVLAVSRAIVVVGGDSNPLFRDKFVQKCKGSCKIAGLSREKFQCDLHVEFRMWDLEQWRDCEGRLGALSKHYEAVVVLPEIGIQYKQRTDQSFLDDFTQNYPNKPQQALTAYKLANRFLTPSGVIILSGSQHAYFQSNPKTINPSLQVLNDQVSCVNLILGERDYTDIDSQSVCVLSEDMEIAKEGRELEQVLDMYKTWSDGRELPFPGSFVKFMRKENRIYPEFY